MHENEHDGMRRHALMARSAFGSARAEFAPLALRERGQIAALRTSLSAELRHRAKVASSTLVVTIFCAVEVAWYCFVSSKGGGGGVLETG
ncbi:hypothetical protein LTR17_011486 [Elasticomyces elasticus]|nr:hypothetical protein LTR17_011486 [Elasticomyces elasticus]